MKSDESILNIAIAAVRRHSIDLESWVRTTISRDFLFSKVEAFANELPVVQFVIDESNWTQITTQRVIGSANGEVHQVHFNELDDIVLGDFKNAKRDHTNFRLVDFNGDQFDFWMETGKPAIAIIYSIDTISSIYKAST